MKLPLKTINRDQFFITALGIALSLLFLGFCVLTSNQGFERRYLDSDIPFVYQLNNSIPLNGFGDQRIRRFLDKPGILLLGVLKPVR
ncbi:MAG: hypothetical protein R3C26_16355 [Calditrichia bacterium]